jgi:hypothetical protein
VNVTQGFGLNVDTFENVYATMWYLFPINLAVNGWTAQEHDVMYCKFHLPTKSVKWVNRIGTQFPVNGLEYYANVDTPQDIYASPHGGWVFLITNNYYLINARDGIF